MEMPFFGKCFAFFVCTKKKNEKKKKKKKKKKKESFHHSPSSPPPETRSTTFPIDSPLSSLSTASEAASRP